MPEEILLRQQTMARLYGLIFDVDGVAAAKAAADLVVGSLAEISIDRLLRLIEG